MIMSGDPRLTDSDVPDLPPMAEVAELIGVPVERWHHQCHAISIAIVRAGLIPHARVARGWAKGVGGQHSWIVCPQYGPDGALVLGDCHARNAAIIDPTIHSYRDDVEGIWSGYADTDLARHQYVAHGGNVSIMAYGRPGTGDGVPIELDPEAIAGFSDDAIWWRDEMFGPLDRRGWSDLLNSPVIDWPAHEFVLAAYRTSALRALVPIDMLGMLTTVNPGRLYLHDDDTTPDPVERDADGVPGD